MRQLSDTRFGEMKRTISLNIHLFKVNNKITRKMCEIKFNNKDTTTTPFTSF